MKKTTITKLTRAALAIHKNDRSGRPALIYQIKGDDYTVASNYFLVRFHDAATFEAIREKIGSENMGPSDTLHQMAEDMFNNSDNVELKDTGILAEDGYGFARFLAGDSFPVTINEAYLDIFSGEYDRIFGAGSTRAVILRGKGIAIGILPIRTNSQSQRIRRLQDLLDMYR